MRLRRILSGFLVVCMCAGGLAPEGWAGMPMEMSGRTAYSDEPAVAAPDRYAGGSGGLVSGPLPVEAEDMLSLELGGIRYQDVLAVAENQVLLVSEDFWREVLGISVLEYPDSRILVQGGSTKAVLTMGQPYMVLGLNRTALDGAPEIRENKLYLPLDVAEEAFDYTVQRRQGTPVVRLVPQRFPYVSQEARRRWMLPDRYDYREVGRAAEVKDQGENGTCWSFASLTALETSARPKWHSSYSADHMSLHNSFALKQEDGGEYTMSMAYLLAWQGPVWEAEDPYGDGYSPDGLEARIHVREMQILPAKDYAAIKEAVFLYGGVQSSLYTSMVNGESRSVYYNADEHAYCYIGSQLPNHDVVIVGWNDHYPKENFQIEVEGDGAFLCVNSWGEAFGDGGYFYVSYYDKFIGETNLVYTGAVRADSDARLYQTDLCGWVGQIGYGRETAYGANVYQAQGQELLEAVGFYATGEDTSYEIYVDTQVEDPLKMKHRKLAARGTVKNSGYYTIELEEPLELKPGQRFAVILRVTTPGAVHPLAIEYQADDATRDVDLTDGEGYISARGQMWESVERVHGCNLCLKAYTRIKEENDLK